MFLRKSKREAMKIITVEGADVAHREFTTPKAVMEKKIDKIQSSSSS